MSNVQCGALCHWKASLTELGILMNCKYFFVLKQIFSFLNVTEEMSVFKFPRKYSANCYLNKSFLNLIFHQVTLKLHNSFYNL